MSLRFVLSTEQVLAQLGLLNETLAPSPHFETEFLCSFKTYPGTPSIDQADFELTEFRLPLLGLKVLATLPGITPS